MTSTDWLTLALVVITGIYAYVTFRILKANEAVVTAMREQQLAMNRPYVQVGVTVRVGTQLLYLVIKNVGRAAAERLRLQLDRPVHCLGESAESRNLATYSAFSRQIDSLPPGAELLFLLGTGPTFFAPDAKEELAPKVFGVKAAYESGVSRFEESTTVDLRPFLNTDVPHDPIAEELERLRRSIDGLPRQLGQELRQS